MPDTNMNLSHLLAGRSGLSLIPARVTGVLRDELEVAADGRVLFARLAIPALYRPVEGDEVLVIESSDAAYVIGVLRANGPTELHAPGDLRLLAPNGRIELHAASVHTHAAEVRVDAGLIAVAAGELRETFGSVYRLVRGLLDIDAGDIATRVRALFSLRAGRLRATASGDVKIDGEQIHLG